MRHVASQVFPEPFNGIELRRVGWQGDQLDLLSMSSEQSKNRFGKMNAIVINHDIDFASSNGVGKRKHLGDHRAEQGILLVLAGCPIQLAADPMNESGSIAFLIFARGLDFALVASLAPTVDDGRQERQVDLILIIQIDFSSLCLPLQLFDSGSFAVIVGIRAGHRQNWSKQFIAMSMQVVTNAALVQRQSRLFSQVFSQQGSRPVRESTAQRSGVLLDDRERLLQVIWRDLGWTATLWAGQQTLQATLVKLMNVARDSILTLERHLSDLWHIHGFGRQQNDLAPRLVHPTGCVYDFPTSSEGRFPNIVDLEKQREYTPLKREIVTQSKGRKL